MCRNRKLANVFAWLGGYKALRMTTRKRACRERGKEVDGAEPPPPSPPPLFSSRHDSSPLFLAGAVMMIWSSKQQRSKFHWSLDRLRD